MELAGPYWSPHPDNFLSSENCLNDGDLKRRGSVRTYLGASDFQSLLFACAESGSAGESP